jgi:ribosomal subunit interface protein
MESPVQVTFRDIPSTPSLSAHVERRAAKLDTFFSRIMSCHVVVEAPYRHSKHGARFHVRIDLHLPGRELVVTKNLDDSKEDAHAAIDDAFSDAERALEAHARLLQPDMKTHSRQPQGVVKTIFPTRGYGFIGADGDGREVYFHKNSVLGARFEKLAVGTRVRFAEEDGDKGPQASTVHVLSSAPSKGN